MIDLDVIKARCEAARMEVNRLCQRGQTWTMSIPVREDDSDIVLTASFRDIHALAAEVERLRGSLEAILDEATSDFDRDTIIIEYQSALSLGQSSEEENK